MADMEAVVDVPEVDTGLDDATADNGTERGSEPGEGGAEGQSEPGEAGATKDDPYTTKFSREMRAALKAWEQSNPEAAKFAKAAKDNHARLFALNQLEPKGIDGVRDTYALLQSVIHGDLKGPEAVTAMQDALSDMQQVDTYLAAGDPKAFEALGEDFNAGLARLAPAYLDRVRTADPAAFEAAIMPHVADTLAKSALVQDYNAIVDVLNTMDDPRLDEKTKLQMAASALGRMGNWLNAQMQKAGELKSAPAADQGQQKIDQQRTDFEKREQDFHWNTQIKPRAAQHENAKFEELFRPYNLRLKLDAAAKSDLMNAFKASLGRTGSSDAEYMRQMQRYRSQKNPDAATVANFVKNGINKHAKGVMEGLIQARYARFLGGKPKPAGQGAQNGAKPGVKGPVSPGVEVRTVKPSADQIDYKNTPLNWLRDKKYRLTNGKVVQVRAQ